MTAQILYTLTDEAPYLATASFLPIVQAYARTAGVDVETRDISLAARIIAQFNDLLPEAQRAGIEADLAALYAQRPALAMVNSDKGITNLHVPSDVLVDASIPAMNRDSGCMWNAGGELPDACLLYTSRCV